MADFWQVCETTCEEHDTTVRALAKELGISPATVTKWKNGSVPNKEIAAKMAAKLDVSVSYLLGDEDISIEPEKKKATFKTLFSIPQRWISLRSGFNVADEDMSKIIKYLNCDMAFPFNELIEYKPVNEVYPVKNLADTDTLHMILNIMDKCADNEKFRILQVQISKVVFYHLKKIGITSEMISQRVDPKKVKYIVTGKKNRDKTTNYGLNFSDLTCLADNFKEIPNYQYMFTGQKENIADMLIRMLEENGIEV